MESLDDVIARHLTEEYVARIDSEHKTPDEFNSAMAEAGFGFLGVPEEFGGTPIDTVTLCAISTRVAKAGLPSGYGAATVQANDILEFGTPEQVKIVMDCLMQGRNAFALGITEPGAGSDNMSMTCSAVHQDGKVTINGVKTLVTGARTSDNILILAKDPAEENKRKQISMYLVPLDTPGISLSPLEKIAWHTTDTSEVYLDNVVCDESVLVGQKGNGFLQLMRNFELERVLLAANQLGLAERAFEEAASYAARRVQFGQPIGNFQQIQMYLTDMAIMVENMRNFVTRCAQMIDEKEPLNTMGAMCKRYCSRAGFEVADLALQIHGGIGLVEGTPIARIWRDSRVNRIGGGTDEVMVHIVGRQIVKDFTAKQ